MVSVVFPAAGKGRRMGARKNKVLLEIGKVPMLVHTMRRFSKSPQVDFLVVVVGADEVADISAMLKLVSGLKPYRVVAGGSERQYSIANGLKAVPEASDVILVHDAARPFVSLKTIEGVIETARREGGAIAAVPAKNTIKFVDAEGTVVRTPARSELWEVQTPQGFRREILLRAYEQAERDGFLGTDDSGLVERLGVPVKVVESDGRNIKVTTPEDMIVAEAFLKEELKGKFRKKLRSLS
ncbi:MAG: 2-C-methyl-D-erythritol 4-phosphate cytidylyltransferase [Selenomonadaceae bacterium]|nr:2-C-methyl-D-erythritol 4-phosphate cytidylyltransferase [Selenomonadaceae bacterium]